MTVQSLTALFFAMVVLAAIPSISVLTVVTHALSGGFWHGVLTAAGVVTGDVVFILIVVYGLSIMASKASIFFAILKYAGAVYLLWLGVTLLGIKWKASRNTNARQQTLELNLKKPSDVSWFSSFLSGLLITLGDQKAVLFYVGFLPAFVDLQTLAIADTLALITVAIIAVGGVKIGYAYLANHLGAFLQNTQARKRINRVAGTLMILIGLYLIVGSS